MGTRASSIGAEVSRRVEQALEEIGWFPASPDFFIRIEAFANLLSMWGVRHNLTAEPENPSELAFHIIDSLMALPVLGSVEDYAGIFRNGQQALDLGSGAGLPGLVLAAATEAEFTLLESRRKRVSFLRVAIAEMRLENVQVEQAFLRPEDLVPSFDVVTARAFAKPAVFLVTAMAALRSNGYAIRYSGPEGLSSDAGLLLPEKELPYRLKRKTAQVSRKLLVWRKA